MRRCTLCKHFSMTFPTSGYSEYTPGDDGYISCLKDVGIFTKYSLYGYKKKLKRRDSSRSMSDMNDTEFYEAIRTAETCTEYEQRENETEED